MNDLMIIIGIAIGLSIMTQLVNKLLINEKFVDKSREKIKKMQKKIKDLDHTSKEFKKKQEKIVNLNFKLMKQQFKPMLFTFLPYILVFYFMGSLFAFSPIVVGSQLNVQVTGSGTIYSECLELNETFEGSETYLTKVESEDCEIYINENKVDVELLSEQEEITYETNDDVSLKIIPPKRTFISLPFEIPFVGDEIGWLGTFIIFSFASSMILNKSLKGVYLRKWD